MPMPPLKEAHCLPETDCSTPTAHPKDTQISQSHQTVFTYRPQTLLSQANSASAPATRLLPVPSTNMTTRTPSGEHSERVTRDKHIKSANRMNPVSPHEAQLGQAPRAITHTRLYANRPRRKQRYLPLPQLPHPPFPLPSCLKRRCLRAVRDYSRLLLRHQLR